VIQSVQKYCSSLKEMRALAFCVSVRHAEFMAEQRSLGSRRICGSGRDYQQLAASLN
jgi:hypothetical protein